MTNLNFDSLPSAVETMANRLERIEELLNEKQISKEQVKKKYNLAQAARYCGMADPTFRTYIYRRKVAGTKFGKAWLFSESDLDKFIQDYRRPTAQELKDEAFERLTKKGGLKDARY